MTPDREFLFMLAGYLKMFVSSIGEMGAWELAEWRYRYSRMPFGEVRDNLHAGIVASTNLNKNKRKGAKLSVASDFLLVTSSDKEVMNVKEIFGTLSGIAKVVSAKELKKMVKSRRRGGAK